MGTNYKTSFPVNDKRLLTLNIIRKKDVSVLWQDIRSDAPLIIWIGLVSVWDGTANGLRKVRKPAWFFLDSGRMCYFYLPFSGEIRLKGFYHGQYPPIWWIYCGDYYCGHLDKSRTWVDLLAVGNIMMRL